MVWLRICRILELKFSFDIRIYFYNYRTAVSNILCNMHHFIYFFIFDVILTVHRR